MNDTFYAFAIVTGSVIMGIGFFHFIVWTIKKIK